MKNKIILVDDCISDLSKYPLSVNLAVSLSIQSKQDVPIIDFSLSNDNDLAMMFNIPKEKNLKNLIESINKYGGHAVKRYFPKHKTGVIPVNTFSFHNNKEVTEQDLRGVLEAYKNSYSNIVIISPGATGLYYEISCEYMTAMIAGFSPDLLSLNRLRYLMDINKAFNFPASQVKPVLCSSIVSGNIPQEQILSALKLNIFGSIDIDKKLLVKSINDGEPFVLSKPGNQMSIGVKNIVRRILSLGDESKDMSLDVKNNSTFQNTPGITESELSVEYLNEVRKKIHSKVIDDFKRRNISFVTEDKKAKEKAKEIIKNVISELDISISRDQRINLVQQVTDDVLGYGCIEEYLNKDEITEIMVTGHDKIYIEKDGRITLTDSAFPSKEHLITVIDRIVAPVGRRIDESSPMVDARLNDGSRVNAVIPPLAIDGPVLTIRKFSKNKMRMNDLIKNGAMNNNMAQFLNSCVQLKKNILISGGTGSGKTTLLNALSSCIDSSERIITIEDSAELKLSQPHVVRMESRPPSLEGTGEISIRDIVINALRMRPDRIIVGECRGKEAFDMLQAMNTGHNGSLTTIHSNSPKDAVSRLVNMVYMEGIDIPEKSVREQIFSGIQIVVQLSRYSDGKRRVSNISEIFIDGGNTEIINTLFKFNRDTSIGGAFEGKYVSTGITPSFINEFKKNNINLETCMFKV